MISKMFKRALKLFVALLSICMVFGFLMLLVRDYSIPVVNTVDVKNNGSIKKTFTLSGQVVAKDVIEVVASERLYVKEFKVENFQMVYAWFPMLVFDLDKLSDSEKNRLQINEQGEYRVSSDTYIEYINNKEIIEAGEVILRYVVNNEDNLQVVAEMNHEVYSMLNVKNTKIYYYKSNYSERVTAQASNTREFEDYAKVYFSLNKNSNEKIRINNYLNIIVESWQQYYTSIVPVTALIPMDELKEYTNCYVYVIVEDHNMLGKQTRVLKRNAYIYSIGSAKAAIVINNEDNMITNLSNLQVVNYATAAIKDGSRVRVK